MENLRQQFEDKHIAIIGAGTEGLAMAKFLSELGAKVELRDQNTELPVMNYKLRAGSDYLKDLDQFDVIIRSPGVPWLTKELVDARSAGVWVTSQIEIFLQNCRARVIGVTGTKGKSTTSSIIHHVLQHAGLKSRLGGNIGEPIIQWLNDLTSDEWVVLELSSFQLQGLGVSPHIAVVLDVTEEHLDHHKSVQEYVEAKQNIVAHQTTIDFAILNADSLVAVEYAASTSAAVWWFSNHKMVDRGSYIKNIAGEAWFEWMDDEHETLMLSAEDLQIFGPHNRSNVAAAIVSCHLAGVANDTIDDGLREFKGLSHRNEDLGLVNGRRVIDDSYATAPDSTIAALNTWSLNPVVLIVGGSSKGYTYESLAKAIVDKQPRVVIAIGDTGHEIAALIESQAQEVATRVPEIIIGETSMAAIVNQALEASEEGDIILFSPGCASFGLFRNVKDRAAQLQSAIADLKKE